MLNSLPMLPKLVKTLILFVGLAVGSIHCKSQTMNDSVHQRVININDTNYTRVVDGVIISNNLVLSISWEQISVFTNKDSILNWGIQSSKPLLLVTTKKIRY